MKWAILLVVVSLIKVQALVLTNGPDANVTAPTNAVAAKCWSFVADNGPFVACGRRIFASVQHVGVQEPVYRGKLYHISRVIDPPSDISVDPRFIEVTEDLPEWAPIYTNLTVTPSMVWLVGGGVGTGAVAWSEKDKAWTYAWGPETSRRLRWSSATEVMLSVESNYAVFRGGQAGLSSGDSGYGVFTADGQYLGPMEGGPNPMIPYRTYSWCALAANYLSYLPDQPLPVPPKPVVPGAPVVTVIKH